MDEGLTPVSFSADTPEGSGIGVADGPDGRAFMRFL
jgi:hypothetical protein